MEKSLVMRPRQMRVKKVFDKVQKDVASGKKPNISRTMLEEGYSDSSARAVKVTATRTWAALMAQVDDEAIVGRVYEIMASEDKRAALTAADMLLKLKDRYPANKVKHAVFDERNSIMVD